MTAEALAWAIGVGFPVLIAALLFIANWLHKLDKTVRDQAKEIADLRTHTAENYVRGHEIAEVKAAVSELRTSLTTKVDELLKAVHELIGKQSR